MTVKAPSTKKETAKWVRNEADRLAIQAGYRFDRERGEFACDWIEDYCWLYEGDLAGQQFRLMDFQRDYLMRLFGWVRWSADHGEWIRRFTHAALWAAKKNGKSPLAAAVNLYLLCGDGEQGQKIYQAAKNGDQAKIAQRHAVEMVKRSPELSVDCKINNQTLLIAHLPTASQLIVLTGDDSRGAKSKEGLNGSVTFDEMHVVDREMYERTSRAGISRKEPLILSFSTAGDDPSSIGYERCQYGRQVNSGERDDLHFLHVEYSIPDTVTEAEIDKDPVKYAKMANPAWGTLVREAEFLEDWKRSKGKPREMARCLQYRFNRWVGSTNRWLSMPGWQKGARPKMRVEDLAGLDCYLGLDLSRTRDLTAAVFNFFTEDSEEVCLWPLFWMPEDTAEERDHLFPFKSWGRSGHIKLTRGGVVDYRVVKDEIREFVERHSLNVIRVYFDPHYAEEITQQIAEGESIGEESVQGIGTERIAFRQTLMSFTGPAKEFERRVTAGLVLHPDNPVLTWQAGHCEIWSDGNNNIRPIKPNPNSGKSVDGIVAGVMTFNDLLDINDNWINPDPQVL